MSGPLETEFSSVGGKRLRVARLRPKEEPARRVPPIVLLHGYPDTLQVWSSAARRLAEAFPVVVFDWPGMGYSEAWPGGATPEHQADRLLALLDAWAFERAVIVGMDMGGQPALAFAARHPDRTAGLVVMNSLVIAEERTSWEIRVLRRFGWNRLLLRGAGRLVFERAVRTSLPRASELPRWLREDMWGAFRRPEVRAFVSKMCAGYQGTLRKLADWYPRIEAPTLVLWGSNDRHFPPEHAQRLHQAVSGSSLKLLPGAEHWMAWHRSEDVASAIQDFLGPLTSSWPQAPHQHGSAFR